jgi:CheY-like chemotaxis protein/anti-sigma regulatory factor (Ser/Thr protein kinase)
MDRLLDRPARILIVDDTPKNIQVLGTALRQHDYQIYVAQSGLQALGMVEEIAPELILLDVMMPELDGFDTCKRLKDNPRTCDIPVIFLTAKSESEDVLKGFELGAVDYVTKPFKSSELLARVRTHLELKHSRDLIAIISQERKELLHILCHDLANSLGAVVTLLNFTEDDDDFGETRAHLLSTAQNGLNLIDLVREMRALEEHKIMLHPVYLADALNKSVRILRQRFSDKKLKLECAVAADIKVEAEEVSLVNSVLTNLLTNAIKFSYSAGVIEIDTQTTERQVILRIIDHGIGIPPKLLEQLFDMTKVTNRPGTLGERGTGFGMPLVKKFMDAYGGSMRIESKTEKEASGAPGTTVSLFFNPA